MVLSKDLFQIINSKLQGAQENGDPETNALPVCNRSPQIVGLSEMIIICNMFLKTKNSPRG